MKALILVSFFFFAACSAHSIGGRCPHDWRYVGQTCFKFMNEKENFWKAMRKCKYAEDDDSIEQSFEEDLSQMMTLRQVNQFRLDNEDIRDNLWQEIRLNAFKMNGKWYSSHRVPKGFYDVDELELVQEVGRDDFVSFGVTHLYTLGKDGDGLVYDPNSVDLQVRIEPLDKYFPYVCLHKR